MRGAGRAPDLTGQRFGKLVVLKREPRKDRQAHWRCVCDCGNERVVRADLLRKGSVTSCGCDKVPKRKPGVGPNFKDITGQRFGKLVAIEPLEERDPRGLVVWRCRCDCGKEANVVGALLRKGAVRGCGCHEGRGKRYELAGQRFGKLVVIEETDKRESGSIVWRCQCDCGNVVDVASRELRSGRVESCGCDRPEHVWRKDLVGQRFGKLVVEKDVGRKRGYVVWRCRCDCGGWREATTNELTSGKVKNCGDLSCNADGRRKLDGEISPR